MNKIHPKSYVGMKKENASGEMPKSDYFRLSSLLNDIKKQMLKTEEAIGVYDSVAARIEIGAIAAIINDFLKKFPINQK